MILFISPSASFTLLGAPTKLSVVSSSVLDLLVTTSTLHLSLISAMVLPLLPVTCLPIPGGMTSTVYFFACFLSGDFGGCCGGVVSDVSGDCGLAVRLVGGLLCCCLSAGSGDCVCCGAVLMLVSIWILAAIAFAIISPPSLVKCIPSLVRMLFWLWFFWSMVFCMWLFGNVADMCRLRITLSVADCSKVSSSGWPISMGGMCVTSVWLSVFVAIFLRFFMAFSVSPSLT